MQIGIDSFAAAISDPATGLTVPTENLVWPIMAAAGPCNMLHSLLCILLISNVLLVLARHRRYHPTHLGYSTSILVVRHFRVIPGSRLPTRLTRLACRRSQIPRPTQARSP